MSPALPSVEEITQVAESRRAVAGPEWEDENGHVNVAHFYAFHLAASETALQQIGLDDDYRERSRCGVFSMEQHFRFYDEVRIGQEISAHVRWLDRGNKVFHGISVIVNHDTATVANTLEVLEGHVDLVTRRAAAFPEGLAQRVDAEIAVHRALPWSLPLAGSMGVRR